MPFTERLASYEFHVYYTWTGDVGPILIVWDTFHASGKSELVVVDVKVSQQHYIDIWRQNLLPWARATFPRNFVFVHGNVTPHTARNKHNFLEREEVEVMQWPTGSPDLKRVEPYVALYQRYGKLSYHGD